MTSTAIVGAAVGIGTAIIGVYVWVGRHISNSSKHPCKTGIDEKFGKVVFMDVCEEKVKRLDDCIESEAKRSTERYEALKETMESGFKEVKEAIRNGQRRP